MSPPNRRSGRPLQPASGLATDDPIDLSMLPPAHRERAREVIRRIAAGESHTHFKGKRLEYDRFYISVPLGRRWRVMFMEVDKVPIPWKCMSHSAYNGRKPGLR